MGLMERFSGIMERRRAERLRLFRELCQRVNDPQDTDPEALADVAEQLKMDPAYVMLCLGSVREVRRLEAQIAECRTRLDAHAARVREAEKKVADLRDARDVAHRSGQNPYALEDARARAQIELEKLSNQNSSDLVAVSDLRQNIRAEADRYPPAHDIARWL